MKKVLIFIGLKIVEAAALFGMGLIGRQFYLFGYISGWFPNDNFISSFTGQCILGSLILYMGLFAIGLLIYFIVSSNVDLTKKILAKLDKGGKR